VKVSDRLAFYPRLPFTIGPQWEQWIGTLRSKEITEANLVLMATLPTSSAGILDAENQMLQTQVINLLYSVLLLGVPAYANMNVLTGANNNGTMEIRQLLEMPKFYFGLENPYQFHEKSAKEAGMIFEVLDHMFTAEKDFVQVKRGLIVFLKGLSENLNYDRLHQFVRSLDALIMSEQGKGATQFRHRCCTFAIHNPRTPVILDNMYELRGRSEHLTDWDGIFPELGEKDQLLQLKIMNQRAQQTEALARQTFRTILTTPSLLEHFRTATSLKNFWSFPDDRRLKLWPNNLKFNLDSISLGHQSIVLD